MLYEIEVSHPKENYARMVITTIQKAKQTATIDFPSIKAPIDTKDT